MIMQGRKLLIYLLPHGHTGSEIGTDGVEFVFNLLLSLLFFISFSFLSGKYCRVYYYSFSWFLMVPTSIRVGKDEDMMLE